MIYVLHKNYAVLRVLLLLLASTKPRPVVVLVVQAMPYFEKIVDFRTDYE